MKETNQPAQSEKMENWDLALEFYFPNTHTHCEECFHVRPLNPLVIGYTWSIVWNIFFNSQDKKSRNKFSGKA